MVSVVLVSGAGWAAGARAQAPAGRGTPTPGIGQAPGGYHITLGKFLGRNQTARAGDLDWRLNQVK